MGGELLLKGRYHGQGLGEFGREGAVGGEERGVLAGEGG